MEQTGQKRVGGRVRWAGELEAGQGVDILRSLEDKSKGLMQSQQFTGNVTEVQLRDSLVVIAAITVCSPVSYQDAYVFVRKLWKNSEHALIKRFLKTLPTNPLFQPGVKESE